MLAVLVVAASVFATTAVAGQDTADDSGEVRIVARKLENSKIEFGLQQRQTDNTWGDRRLPRVRFFPATATVGRWLASSPLALTAGEVRVVARKLENGKIEFGLQQRQTDNTWGDRRLPRVRFFPATATVGRWLASSPLTLTAPRATRQYTASTGSATYTCTLRSDDTLTCWSSGLQTEAPAGQYAEISAGSGHLCALGTSGAITCWGNNESGQATAPSGTYSAVTAGGDHSCALRTSGAVTCWGNNSLVQADPSDGQYTAIRAGSSYTCGLRSDGAITCWGLYFYGIADPWEIDVPDGQYTAVTAAGYSDNTCGLRTDGTITCWGDNYFGQADVPDGQYTAVTVGFRYTCGLRTDRTVTCWGDNFYGQADVPDGQYTAVAAGSSYACALRTDDTLTCWGDDDTEGPPADIPWG